MSKHEEDILDYLKCALSIDDHFSKEPITLSGCSHSVCKSCLIKENKTEIKCGRCGVVTKRDLRSDKESVQTRRLICTSLTDLYKVIEERTSELLQKIAGAMQEKNERVEVLVNYIQEEVEIRIESLKWQLDDTFEKIKSDLRVIKHDLLESEDEIFEEKLNQLRDDIEKKKTQNKEMFYDYQDNCIRMNEKLGQLKDSLYQLDFKPSVTWIDEKSIIGELNYVNKLKDAEPIDHFQSRVLNFFDFSRHSATFRHTLKRFSKFKETKNIKSLSRACKIRDLDWHVQLQNIERGNNKILYFYVGCKSDKHLNKKSTIRARVENRLLHQCDTEKHYLIGKFNSYEFILNGFSMGYELLKYEDLMKPEKGFYNAIDDSITVEVVVTTNGDVRDALSN